MAFLNFSIKLPIHGIEPNTIEELFIDKHLLMLFNPPQYKYTATCSELKGYYGANRATVYKEKAAGCGTRH